MLFHLDFKSKFCRRTRQNLSRFFLDKRSALCYNAVCKEKNLTGGAALMAKDLSVCALLDTYGAFLSGRQRDIMSHYFNDDLSLAEIAENEGTTRQAVSDIIRRGEATLKRYENECGYLSKMSEIKKICASEAADADKVKRIAEIADGF